MQRQSKAQKGTVARVMHEFKHGELRIGADGPKVRNPKQAIAIALHQAGATNQESAADNGKALRRTKAKERKGETAQAAQEGTPAQNRTMRAAADPKPAGRSAGRSKTDLYQEAKRRDLPGRSKMSKAQLERALQA